MNVQVWRTLKNVLGKIDVPFLVVRGFFGLFWSYYWYFYFGKTTYRAVLFIIPFYLDPVFANSPRSGIRWNVVIRRLSSVYFCFAISSYFITHYSLLITHDTWHISCLPANKRGTLTRETSSWIQALINCGQIGEKHFLPLQINHIYCQPATPCWKLLTRW